MRWLRIGGIVGVVGFGLGFNGNPPLQGTNGPSVLTALLDDLGVRLKARKHPVEVLVIDHVERTPKEN